MRGKGLVVLFAFFCGLLVAWKANAAYSGQIVNFATEDVQCRVVVVEKGGEFWNIFRRFASEYYPFDNSKLRGNRWRLFQSEAQPFNPGIDLAKLQPGQRLCLPLPIGTERELARRDNELKRLALNAQKLAIVANDLANQRDWTSESLVGWEELCAVLAAFLVGVVAHAGKEKWDRMFSRRRRQLRFNR